MKILVTGGTGYIGSHTVVELIEHGHQVVVVDNLCNSSINTIEKISKITGTMPQFYQVDIRDKEGLKKVFLEHSFDYCLHFAGLKSVSESIRHPQLYYHNNVDGTKVLLEVMEEFGVKNIVFSSSATVYGNPDKLPITENTIKKAPLNPYGETKSIIEDILLDLGSDWNIVILRYFNPIGAHKSGLLGENPSGVPNNLMPYIVQVAAEQRDMLVVFGDDYDTCDGTGVRDYIHVVDLAKGHVKALNYKGAGIFNLGTGKGTSVLELIQTFERVNKKEIKYKIGSRRVGDVGICYADVSKAKEVLGWKADLTIEDMVKDAWNSWA